MTVQTRRIEKFVTEDDDGVVHIDSDHPLAIAQDALEAEGGGAAGGAVPSPGDAYPGLNKPELVELAHSRGIDSSGTMRDIIARLEADDAGGEG